MDIIILFTYVVWLDAIGCLSLYVIVFLGAACALHYVGSFLRPRTRRRRPPKRSVEARNLEAQEFETG